MTGEGEDAEPCRGAASAGKGGDDSSRSWEGGGVAGREDASGGRRATKTEE